MKLKLSSAALAFFALSSPASADYTNLPIGIDRTASPKEVGVFYNDVWYKIGEFSTVTPFLSISGDAINSGTVPAAHGGTGLNTFTRTGNTTAFATWSGLYTANDCVKIDSNGNLASAGAACGGGGGGSGTVSSGNQYELGYFPGAGSTTTIAGNPNAKMPTSGVLELGASGSVLGGIDLNGSTSGKVSIRPQASAGTYNFNLPTTAGTSGDLLISGGGGSSPNTWSSLATLLASPPSIGGTLPAGGTFSGVYASASAWPYIGSYNSSAPADNKYWDMATDTNGDFTLLAYNDAKTSYVQAMKFTATGGSPPTITNISLDAPVTAKTTLTSGLTPVSSITPGRVSPSPTGNTTNGSATITNLSAVSSSWVGYEISGTGIPACTSGGYADSARAVITAVNTGAGTLTMSCAANATGTGVTLGIGRDYYSTTNSITTRTVGAESAIFGDAATGQNVSWMNNYFAGWGGNNPQTTTGITLTPPNGGTTGMIVGARSSTAASQRIFGERSFIVSDGLALDGTNPRAWNYYGVGYALPATDNVLAQTAFMEAEVYNGWTARDKNPYTTTLGVVGDYQAGCGAGSGGNSCSYAFLIFPNGATFLEGIVFHNAALSTALDGTYGYAVHMATNQALHWSSASGTDAGTIVSDANGDLKISAKSGRTVKAEQAFELSQSTMATMPACDTPRKFSLIAATDTVLDHTTGANGYITRLDQTLTTISALGTGSTPAMFFCDGTNWRLH